MNKYEEGLKKWSNILDDPDGRGLTYSKEAYTVYKVLINDSWQIGSYVDENEAKEVTDFLNRHPSNVTNQWKVTYSKDRAHIYE